MVRAVRPVPIKDLPAIDVVAPEAAPVAGPDPVVDVMAEAPPPRPFSEAEQR